MIKSSFSDRVLDLALSITKGEVSSYGDIARAAGAGGQAARSISGILGRFYRKGQDGIPFHRIVYSSGQVWSSLNRDEVREKLYKKEGIKIDQKGFIVDFESRRKIF